jgi:hypothetical protein
MTKIDCKPQFLHYTHQEDPSYRKVDFVQLAKTMYICSRKERGHKKMKAQDLILNVSRSFIHMKKIQILNYENLRVHIECMDGNKESTRNFKHSTKKGQFLVDPKVVILFNSCSYLLLIMVVVTIMDGCLLEGECGKIHGFFILFHIICK